MNRQLFVGNVMGDAPVDLGIRRVPALPVSGAWREARTLQLAPPKYPPRATRRTVHVGRRRSIASRDAAVDLTGPTGLHPESQVVFAFQAPSARAETVDLVDEGVLNLTRHSDPEPLAFFLARRRLDVEEQSSVDS